MLKVEKDIPIPVAGATTKSGEIWPWLDKLEVGDSVRFMRSSQSIGGALQSWYRYHGREKHFITRSEGAGTRVWRTK